MKHRMWPCLFVLLCVSLVSGADWARFRGPDGRGVSAEQDLPTTWSDTRNLLWRSELPGPGSSSPIVVGDRVYVTSYSGYGVEGGGGEIANLKRHLICIDRQSGDAIWSRTVAAELPEDEYRGYITEHGYASNSPVSDGRQVFAFFGKTGVLGFTATGTQLWKVSVGKESSNRRWGSAASLVLAGDKLIVNASEESRSIRALDPKNGEQIWKAEGGGLELSYGTPTLLEVDDRREIVIGVPGEVWGLNAETGKLRWFVETELTGNISPSVIAGDGVVYVFGGFRGSGSMAIRTGGKGDVTDSHVIWTSRESSYVATPLLHEGHLYWVDDRGQAHCINSKDGEEVYRERLPEISSGGRPAYASLVLAGDHLYAVTRWSGTYVLPAKPEFKVIARNRFSGDDSDFNGTPAISDGRIYLRSNRYLYCVEQDN